MGTISEYLHGLVGDYYNTYPGFFKRQKNTTGLDMFFDSEYTSRVHESIERNFDLDHINL